jgi:hemerythrin superfamily protein
MAMKGNAKHKNGSKKTKSRPTHNGKGINAIDLLMKDHETVQGLFAQFERAREDARKKEMLFEKIRDELQVHTKIEEEIFYPAVAEMGTDRAEDDIERCHDDHEVVDELLNELQSLSPDDSDFDDRMTDLIKAVRKHIELEQGEVFKEARSGLGEEKIEELGRDMEQLKRALKQETMGSEGTEARE